MAKVKYKFSAETIEYVEIKQSKKTKIKKIAFYFIASICISLIYFYFYLKIFNSPEEKALKKENEELNRIYLELNEKLISIKNEFAIIEERDDKIYRAIFNIDPLEIRDGGSGGSNKYAHYDKTTSKNLVISTAERINKLTEKITIENKSLSDLEKLAYSKQKELLHTPAIQPVENKDLLRTGSGFGMRHHPILNIYRPHKGQDFVCPKGSEVYATADGKVSSVRWSTTFGRVVEINHGYGYLTLYGHLSKYTVKLSQKIKRGDLIGYVGSSGLSSGNHLHYEVHKNGIPVNPMPYFFNDLSPDEFIKMKMIADSIKQSMD